MNEYFCCGTVSLTDNESKGEQYYISVTKYWMELKGRRDNVLRYLILLSIDKVSLSEKNTSNGFLLTTDKLLGSQNLYFFLHSRTDTLMLYKAIMRASSLLCNEIKDNITLNSVSLSFDSSAFFGFVKGNHSLSVEEDGIRMSNKKEPISYSQILSLYPCDKNPSKVSINIVGNNILAGSDTIQLRGIDNVKNFVLAYFTNAFRFREGIPS